MARPDILQSLGLRPGLRAHDRFLYVYVARFFGTPILSHLLFGALALVLMALLIRQSGPADLVMAGLLLAALVFVASFFVVSIACDYRYLYFLDLSAMTGALHFICSLSKNRLSGMSAGAGLMDPEFIPQRN